MAGHSHWAGIKRQKGATDQKRAKVFSKLLTAITAASRTEQDPDFNPRLRTAITKAKEANVPAENIYKAIHKSNGTEDSLEELVFEAYGPGGVAIFIDVLADNRNRAVAEIKKIISDHQGKWAESGSVRWAFEPGPIEVGGWTPKFLQEISDNDKVLLDKLIEAIEGYDCAQGVYTNASVKK